MGTSLVQVATQKVNSYVQSNNQEPFCGVVEQLSSINNGQRFLTPVMSVQYGSKTPVCHQTVMGCAYTCSTIQDWSVVCQ